MLSDKARILVVDGDHEISSTLHEILDKKSSRVHTTGACAEALDMLEENVYDVVLLDLGDEGLARIDLMKRVRENSPETSITLLTAHPSATSAIIAVRCGAHDYLVNPVEAEELKHSVVQGAAKAQRARRDQLLLARVRDLIHLAGEEQLVNTHHATSVPHQANGVNGQASQQARHLIIDRDRRRVRQNGKWVDLTPTEFDLLTHLVHHAGQVQEYRKLVKEVQGYEADEWEARNLMKYYVHTLRQKLEPQPADPQYILNVRGVGYLFSSKPAEPTLV